MKRNCKSCARCRVRPTDSSSLQSSQRRPGMLSSRYLGFGLMKLLVLDSCMSVSWSPRQITSYGQFRRHLKKKHFRAYKTTAHCDFYFLRYINTLTYLLSLSYLLTFIKMTWKLFELDLCSVETHIHRLQLLRIRGESILGIPIRPMGILWDS